MCNELRKHGVTARVWTGDELTEPSAFRSLARECKNGRLRAAFVAPHVSEESMVLQMLERLRLLRGPLLVADALMWTLTNSCRFARCTVRFGTISTVGDVLGSSLLDTQNE